MLEAVISVVAEHRVFIGELIGFIAGGIVLASGLPPLKEQWFKPSGGTVAQRQGHLLLAIGNSLWVVSSIFTESIAMGCMAGLNTAIRAAVWWRMQRASRRPLNSVSGVSASGAASIEELSVSG